MINYYLFLEAETAAVYGVMGQAGGKWPIFHQKIPKHTESCSEYAESFWKDLVFLKTSFDTCSN